LLREGHLTSKFDISSTFGFFAFSGFSGFLHFLFGVAGKAQDRFKGSTIIKRVLRNYYGILKGAYELQGVDPAGTILVKGQIIISQFSKLPLKCSKTYG
jgi:hypothetical protein